MDGEDILSIFSVIAVAFILLVLVFIAIPVLGYLMHWVVCDVFRFEMDDRLYWTGVGLVGMLTFIIGAMIKRDSE